MERALLKRQVFICNELSLLDRIDPPTFGGSKNRVFMESPFTNTLIRKADLLTQKGNKQAKILAEREERENRKSQEKGEKRRLKESNEKKVDFSRSVLERAQEEALSLPDDLTLSSAKSKTVKPTVFPNSGV